MESETKTGEKQVVNCEFVFRCPLKWDDLKLTRSEGERFCRECGRVVYFANNQDELEALKQRGECVAVWLAEPAKKKSRFPEVTMGVIVPTDYMKGFEETEELLKNMQPERKPKSRFERLTDWLLKR